MMDEVSFSYCDASEIPFPKWSDQDVNLEKWETLGNKDAKKSQGTKEAASKILFVDDQDVKLPESIPVFEWKRPSEIYPNAEFVITKNKINYTDLKNGSEHLLHSDFMRSFISAVGILEYIGYSSPWKLESVSAQYAPVTEKEPWKPWHHIYSMSKISKGQSHNPKFNPSGKYIVRLYWLGHWRKIYIDDRLPVNDDNVILLPNYVYKPIEEETPVQEVDTTMSKSAKAPKSPKSSKKPKKQETQKKPKMEVEIWPFILCKAIMKIACLSWDENFELIDFNPISCLTGWIFQKISTLDMSAEDMWQLCVQYTTNYMWEEDRKASPATKKDGKGKKDKGKKDKSSSKGSKKSQNKENPKEDGIFRYHVVASCSDIRSIMEGADLENFPSLPGEVLIEQSRDIPLIKPGPKPEYARWKRFRWILWAIRKGIIPPLEEPYIKCLKLFSNLTKNANEEIKQEDKVEADEKKSKKSSSKSSSKKDSKSSKKGDTTGQIKIFPLMDRSKWIDFIQIDNFIDYLYIFYKPVEFETVIKLSDIPASSIQQLGKKEITNVVEMTWPSTISKSRNEPIYIFMDSLDFKYLVINLTQMGKTNQLKKTAPNAKYTSTSNFESTLDSEINSRSKGSEVKTNEVEKEFVPFAYAVLETYNWHTNSLGYIEMFLNTRASKTFLLSLKAGRSTSRMWIKSDNFYVLTILTDLPVVIGSVDVLLNGLTQEAMSLIKLSHDISTNFGKLVQAFGTENFGECLKTFHQTYKNKRVGKLESYRVYELFVLELLDVVKEVGLENDVFALKVLFIDPNIKLCDKKKECEETKCTRSVVIYDAPSSSSITDEELNIKKEELAAVKIQSIFKTIYVKKLLAYHNQMHKKYLDIYEALKRIYASVFSVPKRALCVKLLRNFLQKCVGSLNKEPSTVCADLSSVLTVLSFNGTKSLNPDSFAIICRYRFECNSSKPLNAKVYLFANLPKYIVRLFDNDSLKEICRFTNNASIWPFQKNIKGYTVLSYGWAHMATKVAWKLCFAFVKQDDASLSVLDQNTVEDSITDYYKPNVNEEICKCILNVKQNTYVTFRLATSSSEARLQLRCVNEEGKVLNTAFGTRNVVLPISYLTCNNPNMNSSSIDTKQKSDTQFKRRSSSILKRSSASKSSKISSEVSLNESIINDGNNYTIEAMLLENSWPLSINEWLVTKCEKIKSLLYPHSLIYKSGSLISNESNSSKDYSKFKEQSSFTSNRIQNPYWALNITYDIGDKIQFFKDTKRAEQIKQIKKSWYETDDNRTKKSRSIRYEYLMTHSLKEISDKSSQSERSPRSSFSTFSTISSLRSDLFNDDGCLKKYNKWKIESQILPPFDLIPYTSSEASFNENTKCVKKDAWEKHLQDKFEENSNCFSQAFAEYKENFEKLRCDQLENFVLVKDWYQVIREDSSEAMKSSYQLRDKFIDMLIEADKEKNKDVKQTTKKDKKKDKKSKKK